MDIPEFVSMPSTATTTRVARTAGCSRSRTAGSSSEEEGGSKSSSTASSPTVSPRGPPADSSMADIDAAASSRLAGLHVNSKTASGGVRFAADEAMETDGAGEPPRAAAEGSAPACRSGEDSAAAEGGVGARPAGQTVRKQVEFDGDGWEDVGDSADEDPALFGLVGKDEDDYYDPDMDDLDQQFVDMRRLKHLPQEARMPKAPKAPRKGRKAAQANVAGSPAPVPAPGAQPQGGGMSDDKSAPPCGAQPKAQPGGAGDADGKMGETEAKEMGDANGANAKKGPSTNAQAPVAAQWSAYVAPSGHEYYHEARSGETTWIKPDG